MKTGSNQVGLALAAAIALLAWAGVAPAPTSAVTSEAGCLIRCPSTPIVTIGACTVSGAPLAPRIGARGAQVVCSSSWPPVRSGGAIVAGDQATSHFPERWTSRSTVRMVTVPMPEIASRSETGSDARAPSVRSVPGA